MRQSGSGFGERTISASFVPPSASSATVTSVAGSATSVQLLAANGNRKGALFVNDSTSDCYLKYGTTASSSSYTVKIAAGAFYNMPTPTFTGIIECIWDSAAGNMVITEM